MKIAADELIKLANELATNDQITVDAMKQKFLDTTEAMLRKDIEDNKAIGTNGAQAILQNVDGMVRILTHCNTGSLATAGYGTALGVVRKLFEMNRLEHIYCTETRPYNQGARLTAFELVHDKLPATLIIDSVVAALLRSKVSQNPLANSRFETQFFLVFFVLLNHFLSFTSGCSFQNIAAVVVGADRVVANGDTANKIGTYQIAVVAKYHNVPFYIAAPLTSIDLKIPSGDQIVIEERPDREMTHVGEHRIAANGIKCWNPAFDVTPAHLITGK